MIKNKVYNMNNKADNYFKDNKGINYTNNLNIINRYSDEYIKKINNKIIYFSKIKYNINNTNNNYNRN
jgi:hypothetical protein